MIASAGERRMLGQKGSVASPRRAWAAKVSCPSAPSWDPVTKGRKEVPSGLLSILGFVHLTVLVF